MITCNHCGAETSNGLTLCDLCQRFTVSALEYLPVYFTNLSRWRPGRAGSRPVPGSRVLFDGHDRSQGTGDRISDRLDHTALMLTECADKLADARPYLRRLLDRLADAEEAGTIDDAESVAWLCRGFAKFLPAVATLDWAGEFVTKVAHHEEVLRNLTNECVPGWYAGACRKCEAGTFAVPGLTWVTCGGCGTTTYARDHLEVIVSEAHGWVAPPRRLAEALVALVDGELSVDRLHKRIAKWGEREQIDTVRKADQDGDPIGPKRHRFGDVLGILYSEGATRLDKLTSRTAS
jgi:hypothetical protein